MLKKSVFILSLLFATQLALAADSYEATTNVLTGLERQKQRNTKQFPTQPS